MQKNKKKVGRKGWSEGGVQGRQAGIAKNMPANTVTKPVKGK